jgi:hypothetical protein
LTINQKEVILILSTQAKETSAMTLTFINETTDIDALLAPYTKLSTIDEVNEAEEKAYSEISEEFMAEVASKIAGFSDAAKLDTIKSWIASYHLATFFGLNSNLNGYWGVSQALGLTDEQDDLILAIHNEYNQKWMDASDDIRMNRCVSPGLHDKWIAQI